jgi:hypothetical protein
MAKTYLQLINSVHARLRAGAAASVTADADTTILGAFVNQAKEQVETEWKWQALRKTITFTCVAGTASYDTSSLSIVSSDPAVTSDRSVLLWDAEAEDLPLFWDVTANNQFRMSVWARDRVIDYIRTANNTNSTTQPGIAAVYQNGAGLTVLFADTPTSVRDYSMEVYCPQDELTSSDGSTTILAPWQPIRDLAAALAAEERGDLYGVPAQRFYDFYADSLAMAISANKDNDYDDAMVVV